MLKGCGITPACGHWTGNVSMHKTRRHSFNTCVLNTASEPGNSAEGRSAAALGAIELPRGVLWWHNRQHSVYQHDVVHGQDFVLQRPRSGGPGLILSQRLSSIQIVDKSERKRVQVEMYKATQGGLGTQLTISDRFTFDLTDYALVEEATADVPAELKFQQFPPTACTGIVLRDQPEQTKQQVCCIYHTLFLFMA